MIRSKYSLMIFVACSAFVWIVCSKPIAAIETSVDSGETLYQKYFALLLSQIEVDGNVLTPQDYYEKGGRDHLDQVIREWEDAFADDPDYWEIRFQDFDDDERFVLLIEKFLQGIESPGLYFEFFVYVSYYLVESDPELALVLVDRAISLDPDNSYFYYVKAWIEFEMNDEEAAHEALRAGNSAPKNAIPQGYLEGEVLANLDSFKTEGEKAVAFEILIRSTVPSLGNTLVFFRECCDSLFESYSPEYADELLTFSRRFAQMDGQSLIGVMIGQSNANYLLKGMLDGPAALSESEKHQVHAMLGRFRVNAALIKRLFAQQDLALDDPESVDWSQAWQNMLEELSLVEKLKPSFDAFDPPPFAEWAAN